MCFHICVYVYTYLQVQAYFYDCYLGLWTQMLPVFLRSIEQQKQTNIVFAGMHSRVIVQCVSLTLCVQIST